MHCATANFIRLASLGFLFASLAPMTRLRPCHPKTVVSPLGVFSSCVFPSLFVLVRLFVAFLFPSVVSLVWRCLVAAVPGCCVLLRVLFLGRLSGAVFLPVLARSAFAFVVSRLVGCVVWVRPGWCSVSGSVWFVSVPVVR